MTHSDRRLLADDVLSERDKDNPSRIGGFLSMTQPDRCPIIFCYYLYN